MSQQEIYTSTSLSRSYLFPLRTRIAAEEGGGGIERRSRIVQVTRDDIIFI